jgi:hypothetical protein
VNPICVHTITISTVMNVRDVINHHDVTMNGQAIISIWHTVIRKSQQKASGNVWIEDQTRLSLLIID